MKATEKSIVAFNVVSCTLPEIVSHSGISRQDTLLFLSGCFQVGLYEVDDMNPFFQTGV